MIGVNGSFLTSNMTGVQRYAFQLLMGLLEANRQSHVRVYVSPKASDVRLLDDLKRAGADVMTAPGWARNKQVFEQVALPRMASRDGVVRLVHLNNSVSLLSRRQQLCFLYDLAPVRFAHTFRPAYRAKFRAVLLGARWHRAQIATLSEFSRRELESVGLRDIIVVPAGLGSPMLLKAQPDDIGATTDASPPQLKNVPRPYALILASSDPRKRVAEVVDHWPAVFAELGLTLVVVGGTAGVHRSPPTPTAAAGVVRIEGRVSDRDLVQLIRRSSLAVFASAYEGGALAPQEVLTLGTPVVAADIPAFRELLPSSVSFFSRFDALTDCCRKAMTANRPMVISEGEATASWVAAAALIAD
jgi:glycosyltransferase involved in cell wall biosynthesis